MTSCFLFLPLLLYHKVSIESQHFTCISWITVSRNMLMVLSDQLAGTASERAPKASSDSYHRLLSCLHYGWDQQLNRCHRPLLFPQLQQQVKLQDWDLFLLTSTKLQTTWKEIQLHVDVLHTDVTFMHVNVKSNNCLKYSIEILL